MNRVKLNLLSIIVANAIFMLMIPKVDIFITVINVVCVGKEPKKVFFIVISVIVVYLLSIKMNIHVCL